MLGLKRGVVELCKYDKTWGFNAKATISKLNNIFGNIAVDIQHIGSTSIKNINSKPIIDIAVGVNNFEDVFSIIPELENKGFIHKPENDNEWQIFFSCGDFKKDIRTHHIHIVKYKGKEWNEYILFRDFLNSNIEFAKEYELLKDRLKEAYPNDRINYTNGKAEFINKTIQKANDIFSQH